MLPTTVADDVVSVHATIAATAAATNRILLTTDASAAFGQLAGVHAEVLPIA